MQPAAARHAAFPGSSVGPRLRQQRVRAHAQELFRYRQDRLQRIQQQIVYHAELRPLLPPAQGDHRRPSVGRHPLPHCRHARSRAGQEGRPLPQEALLPAGPTPMTNGISKPIRISKRANNNSGINKETTMNPLTQFKKTPILSLLIMASLTIFAALTAMSALATPPPDPALTGHFGRMFRNLPPFAPPTNAVRDALMELGRPGGIMDANDDLAAGPVALITDPNLSLVNRNNPTDTAGVTFFGQFLDHDMTFDQRSRLGFPTQPIISQNARTCFFDLDSVYAGGPGGNPELYDLADPIKFRVESDGQFEDLPRDPINHVAIIGDPRNDENMMIAGLHAAFLLFHNHAVDLVRSQNPSITDVQAYFQAHRLTVWHYEWMILHEFLPHVIPQSVIDDVLTNGRHFYNPLQNRAFIPVEFQITYRFGHSMVRPSYRANLHGDNGQPFFGMVFDP